MSAFVSGWINLIGSTCGDHIKSVEHGDDRIINREDTLSERTTSSTRSLHTAVPRRTCLLKDYILLITWSRLYYNVPKIDCLRIFKYDYSEGKSEVIELNRKHPIESIGFDSLRIYVVTSLGECLIWNTPEDFELHPNNPASVIQFSATGTSQAPKYRKVICNSLLVLLLSNDGRLYKVMESPSDDNGRHALAAVEFDFPVDVVEDVRCGLEHFLILTETGRIYGYGLNSRGQLGSGCAVDVTCSATPLLIEALHGIKVTSIDCGAWHSVALTEFGDVYTWGWNESGQLGLVNDDAEAERPTEDNRILIVSTPTLVSSIPDDVNIVKMSCGTRHTVALSEDGFLWAWGWNKYGQLCTGDEDNCTVPIKVETFGHRIRDLRASRWLTFIQI